MLQDDEIKTLFFRLIHAREPQRAQLVVALSAPKDTELDTLAQLGAEISKIFNDELSPRDLNMSLVNSLSQTDFIYKLIELCGQHLIDKALSISESNQLKKDLLEHGLRLLARALNGGVFPLSEESVESIRRAKLAERRVERLANEILRLQSIFSPPKDVPRLRATVDTGPLFRGKRTKTG